MGVRVTLAAARGRRLALPLARDPRGPPREAELLAPGRIQVFRAFLQRKPGDAPPVRHEERMGELGSLLRHLTQHPADRLPDEELALVDHSCREARPEREIASAGTKRVVLRQKGGA